MKEQGHFEVGADGATSILIGANLDPRRKLHHEAIHAQRALMEAVNGSGGTLGSAPRQCSFTAVEIQQSGKGWWSLGGSNP